MDNNVYALETLVEERLAEARAHARDLSLVTPARRRRRPFRVRLGLRLIVAGRRLCGTPTLAAARPS